MQLDTIEAAAKAIAMNGSDFGGRELFIDSAESRPSRPSGGSDFGGGRGAGETSDNKPGLSWSILAHQGCYWGIAMNGTDFNGRELFIDSAESRPSRP